MCHTVANERTVDPTRVRALHFEGEERNFIEFMTPHRKLKAIRESAFSKRINLDGFSVAASHRAPTHAQARGHEVIG